MSVPSQELKNYIGNILDKESLAEISGKLPEIMKEMMAAPFINTPKTVIRDTQADIIDAFNTAYAGKDAPENIQQIFTDIITFPEGEFDGSSENLKSVMKKHMTEKIAEHITDKEVAKVLTESLTAIVSNHIDSKSSFKSVEEFRQGNDTADLMIKYIDKKFNTTSDEDLLVALNKLSNMSNEEFMTFMSDATNEDLGIKNVDAVEVARQIHAQKDVATKQFEQNTRIQTIYTAGPQDQEAAEWQYFSMKQGLEPVANSIEIDKLRSVYADKYGVITAFPDAKIMTDDEISMQSADFLASVKDAVGQINQLTDKSLAAAQLNNGVKNFVRGNVLDKYQSKAAGLINSYVKAVRNNSSDAEKIAKDFDALMKQAHITKHPTEMLQAFVSELQANIPNEDRINQLRDYLSTAYSLSEYAEIEYGLIKNAENAVEGMTRQSFGEHALQTADGQTIELDSDQGVLYLADKLPQTVVRHYRSSLYRQVCRKKRQTYLQNLLNLIRLKKFATS